MTKVFEAGLRTRSDCQLEFERVYQRPHWMGEAYASEGGALNISLTSQTVQSSPTFSQGCLSVTRQLPAHHDLGGHRRLPNVAEKCSCIVGELHVSIAIAYVDPRRTGYQIRATEHLAHLKSRKHERSMEVRDTRATRRKMTTNASGHLCVG